MLANSIEELSGSAAVGPDDVGLVSAAGGSAALEGSVVVVEGTVVGTGVFVGRVCDGSCFIRSNP